MINPLVERRFADCSELIESWRSFLDQFSTAVKAEDASAITTDSEQRFLEIKARIAMLHDSFMDSLKHDKNVGQNMLALVNRSITLRHMRKLSPSDQKKVEIEWHECYLLLNETVGQLGEERDRLANVNEFAHRMGRIKETLFANLKWFFLKSIYFRVIAAVSILAAIVFLTPSAVWDKVRATKGIGPPFSAFLDIKRDTLKLGGPYSSADKIYLSTLAKPPAEFTVTETTSEKSTASAIFETLFNAGDMDAKAYLDTCTEFKAATVKPSDSPLVNASLFFWFERDKAVRFALEWDRARNDSNNTMAQAFAQQTTVFHVENVLIVLTNGPEDMRQKIRRDIF